MGVCLWSLNPYTTQHFQKRPQTKYRCVQNNRRARPYEFKGFGAIDVIKPYNLTWFGDIDGPEPYEFIDSRPTRCPGRYHEVFGPVSEYGRGLPTETVPGYARGPGYARRTPVYAGTTRSPRGPRVYPGTPGMSGAPTPGVPECTRGRPQICPGLWYTRHLLESPGGPGVYRLTPDVPLDPWGRQ